MRNVYDKVLLNQPDYVAPDVVVDGMTITVPEGTKCNNGETLLEDFTYELEAPPVSEMTVQGIMVKERATGDVSLLIDEISDTDPPWNPSRDDPYEWLHAIFVIRVPAGTTNLETCDIDIWRFVHVADALPGEG